LRDGNYSSAVVLHNLNARRVETKLQDVVANCTLFRTVNCALCTKLQPCHFPTFFKNKTRCKN